MIAIDSFEGCPAFEVVIGDTMRFVAKEPLEALFQAIQGSFKHSEAVDRFPGTSCIILLTSRIAGSLEGARFFPRTYLLAGISQSSSFRILPKAQISTELV